MLEYLYLPIQQEFADMAIAKLEKSNLVYGPKDT